MTTNKSLTKWCALRFIVKSATAVRNFKKFRALLSHTRIEYTLAIGLYELRYMMKVYQKHECTSVSSVSHPWAKSYRDDGKNLKSRCETAINFLASVLDSWWIMDTFILQLSMQAFEYVGGKYTTIASTLKALKTNLLYSLGILSSGDL